MSNLNKFVKKDFWICVVWENGEETFETVSAANLAERTRQVEAAGGYIASTALR